jgi:hypothetical protein
MTGVIERVTNKYVRLYYALPAKLQKAPVCFDFSVRQCVCPPGTIGLQLEGFS